MTAKETFGLLGRLRDAARRHTALLKALMHLALDFSQTTTGRRLQLDGVDLAVVENEKTGDTRADAHAAEDLRLDRRPVAPSRVVQPDRPGRQYIVEEMPDVMVKRLLGPLPAV